MLKRLRFLFLMAVLGLAWAVATPVGAALQAVGPVTAPHGFPLYYTDTNNLSLELCLDEGWCFFDEVDPNNPNHVELGVGGEVFWWMADAEAEPFVDGGKVLLVLAIEGTFGGSEDVVNGQQISFGRVRVRVDVPVAGNYVVTHPYGTLTFNNVTVEEGINYTADIGAANFLDVEAGFAGTLTSPIGPFLTWPGYEDNTDLQVPILDELGQPTGEFIQYVGNMDIPHVVVGSPLETNFFRVEGPNGLVTETDLFNVMGRVYDGKEAIAHTYPDPPEPNLVAVGPINRLDDFGLDGSAAELDNPFFLDGAFVADETVAGYPLGYPVYYEDAAGLQLTICQGGNPMCISDPVVLSDPDQAALLTGGETFWWSADASVPLEVVGGRTFTADLVLGLEGTFGGDESLEDGNQIAFGRTRIRVDTPVAGDYTIIYPYGVKTFTNVPAGRRAINFTADIGIADPSDPDFAFIGALFSEIGPNFLTWTTFDPTLANNDPALVKLEPAIDINGAPLLDGLGNPVINTVHYVGDPGEEHPVKGGSNIPDYAENGEVNYFRVIGPGGLDVRTNDFAISGRVYDPNTFRVIPQATVPVANPDTATTIGTTPVVINVLANDSLAGAPIPAGATVALAAPDAANGTAVVSGTNITYTANAGFAGTDTFGYTVTVGAEISAPATVTVTVLPNEAIDVTSARLDTRRMRWDIRGTGNETAEGVNLTVRQGSLTGPVIGTATVNRGRWSLRATNTGAQPVGAVVIYVITGTTNHGPFTVQAR